MPSLVQAAMPTQATSDLNRCIDVELERDCIPASPMMALTSCDGHDARVDRMAGIAPKVNH
jgi:hypothetical protein